MLQKVRTTLRLTADELANKVTWPTWDELQSSAIVTLIASLIIALVVFGMDKVIELVVSNIYRLA